MASKKMRIPRIRKKKASMKTTGNIREIVARLKRAYIMSQKPPEPQGREPGAAGASSASLPEGYPHRPGFPHTEVPERPGKPEKKKETEEAEVPGVKIPMEAAGKITKGSIITTELKKESLHEIDVYYNLVPRFPKRGEKVFAYARIKWSPEKNQLVYSVIEPQLSQGDLEIMEETRRTLEERLDIDFIKLGEVKAKSLLRETIRDILTSMKLPISPDKIDILIYYLEKDIVGLGKLEPLMHDPNIEDISCDGVGIPIYVYHRDPQFGSMVTNIMFNDHAELNTFVIKLAQRCRKTISIAEPLLDASLPDGSRIQATLGTDIARKGSNFTIRKFAKDPLTPTHMIKFGTVNPTQMAYMWLAIENGQSILISGGTATGKTSMLNALSLFIRPSLKIVSIEDTPELRLPHPHWIPEVARTAISEEGAKGEVSLFDLLKSSLRQRPDYIVMGEVRGKEAFVLFQQMATGHPSLATIHAASMEQLIDRLTTPPISLPPTLLENINIIVFLTLARLRGSYVRRADTIMEVVGVKNNRPLSNRIFIWDPTTDGFSVSGQSVILKNLARRLGISEDSIKDELVRRKTVLEWMADNNVMDFREVAKIISTYYTDPDNVIDMVESA